MLLDIVMPGIDGYEVCRRLRAVGATRELPIMFLSSLEDVKDKTRGFEVGANDYVTKPFEVLEVKARVRSLLKAKAYADAVKAALERDLRIAREIQMGILPADSPPCTQGYGAGHPRDHRARAAGGGRPLRGAAAGRRPRGGGGRRRLGQGDPGGPLHGRHHDLLRTMARQMRPRRFCAGVNDELAAQNPRCMFVTLQCLVFDVPNRRVAARARAPLRRSCSHPASRPARSSRRPAA